MRKSSVGYRGPGAVYSQAATRYLSLPSENRASIVRLCRHYVHGNTPNLQKARKGYVRGVFHHHEPECFSPSHFCVAFLPDQLWSGQSRTRPRPKYFGLLTVLIMFSDEVRERMVGTSGYFRNIQREAFRETFALAADEFPVHAQKMPSGIGDLYFVCTTSMRCPSVAFFSAIKPEMQDNSRDA